MSYRREIAERLFMYCFIAGLSLGIIIGILLTQLINELL